MSLVAIIVFIVLLVLFARIAERLLEAVVLALAITVGIYLGAKVLHLTWPDVVAAYNDIVATFQAAFTSN